MDGALWVIAFIGGTVSALIASSKGRNAIGWFVFGFFFPLIGIIVASVVSNEAENQRIRDHARQERRRLRRELDQERRKGETFRRHTADRIDAHDRMLGTNTRENPALAAGAPPAPQRMGAGAAPPPPPQPHSWFYLVGEDQVGPVDQQQLKQKLADGQLAWETLVWREGLSEWVAASRVRSLRA